MVLSPDGRSLALDVSPDFGSPADSHWLLGYEGIRPPVRLHGATAVVAVNLGNRYYHWLLEELPRLLGLAREGDVGLIANQHAPFIREAFELGQFHGPIWPVGRHTHYECDQLIVPDLVGRSGEPTQRVVGLLREFTQPWRGNASAFGEKLYISRENAGRRRVLNEAELWTHLKTRGFVKLRLEEMSWREQINAFAHARMIVAPHGAGLANLVFSNPGVSVVEFLNRDHINPCFQKLSTCVGAHYQAVISHRGGPNACVSQSNRYDIEVDASTSSVLLRTLELLR
jgi:capsular polysaccharide biosynthesis protein